MSGNVLLGRQLLAPLGKLTVAALLGAALAFATLLLTILVAGSFVMPLLIVAIVLLVVAGIVATGYRWTPLLGALMGLGTIIGGVFTQQYFVYHLTHPAEVVPFLLSLLICVFAVVAICTGIGATVQNYSGVSTRQAPRWLPIPLASLGGFVLGALLVALLVAATPSPSGTTSVNGTSAVHMGVSNFTQSTVTIAKGSKLLLIDDGQFPHIISNGMWIGNTPHPLTEPGSPIVRNVNVNGNSVTIGPFNTAGTYHIYCTIHPGMKLTIIVQ